ncbi:DNA-directed DNA polymerase [Gordonia bronchialis DSM 43247]|jgi:DNA polymerase-4|uniref:DNA polymerase IV n=1 Tax=Gordonia bronchialis (strain ATCC 25592 / DSM 43247 / BCRC 13721 / JCM 3198 / KCTC 3076 / NBRC 16047 / NCTC 10667) TaxID=526226 RepID=D0L8F5_GORB4|nr:DNA polymerase IV [Gordonia bronchialis]ACY23903.1 DNA-directed DNA polymerase [Gordonia bronchialis DSM 43247]MCC3322069.1 DNA polymerase IV [Gordonia bronchialis]QGS26750.1 DNA polymerase IV [Gordonia bronchialis]UAK36873.1 DNA polymerase IV [Gordonia bronchialis]STQ66931.1 DNA polymerase IV [Gordonia bronchialis]
MRIERRTRDDASILHADLDSFYASVEQRDNPELRGKPVIVGGGVVLAASYEAKAFGVRTPMPGHEARALCPRAIVVRPRFEAYMDASKAVFEIFRDTTPVVEGISVDEAFLDVGGLRRISGTPENIGAALRRRVREEVGLPISVGGARSKFLAKVASAVGKPDGLLIVEPGTELAFLHPLPVRRLWGVGPVTEAKLHDAGVSTIGQMAELGERALRSIVGPAAGRHLFALSLAQDPRRVETGRRRSSIGSQRALGRRPKSEADLEATVVAIVERLGKRLRTAERVCRTVVLRLRFDDFARATRSRTLIEATDRTDAIMIAARGLLADAMPVIRDRGCTLVGLSLTNLDDHDCIQLTLPFERDHGAALDTTMDSLRDRFGRDSVTRAVLINRHHGDDAPMLPD